MKRILCFLLMLPVSAHGGAVILDGTLGPAGGLTGPHYAITADRGSQVGENLFHSFSRFDLGRGESATFSGPSSTRHVISRVTGGTPSSIDGTIRSTLSAAEVWFINPAGVVFGPDAALDVKGTFHAATADYLALADGGRFDARNPGQAVLTSAPPSAFGFLDAPVALTVSGASLQQNGGGGLTLVGGELKIMHASLGATTGNVSLLAAGAGGEARLTSQGVDGSGLARLGGVTLEQSRVTTQGTSTAGAGAIRIEGGSLVVTSSSLISRHSGTGTSGALTLHGRETLALRASEVRSVVSGTGAGAEVALRADRMGVAGGTVEVRAENGGTGGSLAIDADTLSVSDGGRFWSTDAGPLTVRVAGDFTLSGAQGKLGSQVLSSSSWSVLDPGARAGDVTITAGSLTLLDGGRLQSATNGAGAGGRLTLEVAGLLRVSGQDPDGNGGWINASSFDFGQFLGLAEPGGAAGDVTVRAGSFDLLDGAKITSDTFGRGRGGNLSLTVGSTLRLAGSDGQGFGSSLYASSVGLSNPAGAAGNVVVQARELLLLDGATISSSTRGSGAGGSVTLRVDEALTIAGHSKLGGIGGVVSASSDGTVAQAGDAGQVEIVADRLSLRDGGMIDSSTAGIGAGGNILITVRDHLELSGVSSYGGKGSMINVSAYDPGTALPVGQTAGRAGELSIRAGSLDLLDGGRLQSVTFGPGRGGGVALEVAGEVRLAGLNHGGRGSMIGATSESSAVDAGDAGSISLHSGSLMLQDGAELSTATWGAGRGGNLDLRVDGALVMAGVNGQGEGVGVSASTYGAQAGAGGGGTVRIEATQVTLRDQGWIAAATTGAGTAGQVILFAHEGVSMSGRSSLATSGAEGAGGDLEVRAGRISLSEQAWITAAGKGSGRGGNVSLRARGIEVADAGRITTQTTQSDGGDITLAASELLLVRGGEVSTSVKGGAGNGGNLTIQSPDFVVLDGGRLVANAFGGRGGNIQLRGSYLLQNGPVVIQASSQLGISGEVQVDAPLLDLGATLDLAPNRFAEEQELGGQRCAARRKGSSLVVLTRGGAGVP